MFGASELADNAVFCERASLRLIVSGHAEVTERTGDGPTV